MKASGSKLGWWTMAIAGIVLANQGALAQNSERLENQRKELRGIYDLLKADGSDTIGYAANFVEYRKGDPWVKWDIDVYKIDRTTAELVSRKINFRIEECTEIPLFNSTTGLIASLEMDCRSTRAHLHLSLAYSPEGTAGTYVIEHLGLGITLSGIAAQRR